jgi:glycosyltransferase involved in cell wall biosynthesis
MPRLVREILRQAEGRSVELLVLVDNKMRSTGAKRNALISMAQGTFFWFVDDDDRIASTAIDDVLAAIAANPEADCVVFDAFVTLSEHDRGKPCKYGVEYDPAGNTPACYTRYPGHMNVWRKALVEHLRFADRTWGEDIPWMAAAVGLVKQQVRIDKVLYFYDARDGVSESRTGINNE